MYCGFVDNGLVLNKVLYRFTATTANIGAGPLEFRDVTHPDLAHDVFQRVHDSEGGFTEELIASFPDAFFLDNRHLYFPGFSTYNLRTVLPGDGVGPVVSTQDKTSRAVVDSTAYDTALPGAPDQREYSSVTAPILGISVGWADVYGLGFPGQWVEVTDLAPGPYWLEMIVDPYNRIQESDEANNTARIKINVSSIPSPQDQPGDFDRDGDVDAGDYVLWRDTLGTVYAPPLKAGTGADGDANHRVDAPDYAVWRAHFGSAASSSAGVAAASVPEPTAVTLLVGCVIAATFLLTRSVRR